MTELHIIPGRHNCGRKMDLRMADVKGDDGKTITWIMYSVCKHCQVVFVSDIISQQDEPVQEVDYTIDDTITAEGEPFDWDETKD